jgi:hypothetical protein
MIRASRFHARALAFDLGPAYTVNRVVRFAAVVLVVGHLALSGACGKSTQASSDAGGTAGAVGGGSGNGGRGGAAGSSAGAGGLAGAGGVGGAGGAGGMTGSATALVNAFCAAARACCAKDGRPLDPLASCETNAAETFGAAEIDAGTIRVDGAKLDACVAAYQHAATSCTVTEVLAACHGMFIGTLPAGATCVRVADCRRDQGPMVCVAIQVTSGVTPTTGTCQPAPRGKNGDPCLLSCPSGQDDCSTGLISGTPNPPLALCHEADGLFCDTDQTCKPLNAPGADCFLDEGCGSGSYCLPGCQPLIAIGAACQLNRSCGPGATCASGACAAAPLATDGACDGTPQPPTF